MVYSSMDSVCVVVCIVYGVCMMYVVCRWVTSDTIIICQLVSFVGLCIVLYCMTSGMVSVNGCQ